MSKPTIAHVCQTYLPITETFIYRYLTSFTRVQPVVLAEKRENVDDFPLDGDIYDCSNAKFSLPWLINGIAKKLSGDDDFCRSRVLKKSGASLLHAHFGPVGYGLLCQKRQLGLPLVTTFYGYDMSRLPEEAVWRERYDELFRQGDLFLVEGSHMKKGLMAIGCPEEKIAIQHIAIDMKLFPFRERLPKKEDKVILFFCGRLTEKKGLVYALMALKEIVSSFPNIVLRVVGDGDLRHELEAFIKEKNLGEYVEMLGFQSHEVVSQEMAQADIYIQPSVTAASGDTEGGAPTILLEAQAAGVPILATQHADIPEVVVDGDSGLLSPERDWQQFAANLVYLLEHQEKWKEFGKAGRSHVAAQYDIEKEVGKLENLYFQLLS